MAVVEYVEEEVGSADSSWKVKAHFYTDQQKGVLYCLPLNKQTLLMAEHQGRESLQQLKDNNKTAVKTVKQSEEFKEVTSSKSPIALAN